MNPIIVLMTDFGLKDTYVAVMKGIMLNICPDVQFVDLTHQIPPQNVREAAFLLKNAYAFFPNQTIFLSVVDPGVGSMRRPIAVKTSRYSFVAPDNGLLSYTLASEEEVSIVDLSNKQYQLSYRSNTFHGRDIFAPAAAHLAAGISLEELGQQSETYMRLPPPQFERDANRITGEIISIDHFGNIVTSIGQFKWGTEDRLTLHPAFGESLSDVHIHSSNTQVKIAQERIVSLRKTYSEAERGEILALIGSSGYLEIAVNQGNASHRLEAVVGDRVELILGDAHAAVHH